MKFNISNEQKERIVNGNITAIETEIYTELLYLGIDPETFDVNFLNDKDSPEDNLVYSKLKNLLSRRDSLKAML